MLVIALEGSSLKLNLPDVRGSSKIPLRFQILDYGVLGGNIIRSKYDVDLTWADDPNRCTIPADCPDPVVEEEKASYLLSSLSAFTLAASYLLSSLSAFTLAALTLIAF